MADYNIPFGGSQSVSDLDHTTTTVEGNSTAACGAGGGNFTVENANHATITVTGGIFTLTQDASNSTITLNNATLNASGGHDMLNSTINYGTGVSSFIASPDMSQHPNFGGVSFTGFNTGDTLSNGTANPITGLNYNPTTNTLTWTQVDTHGQSVNYDVSMCAQTGANFNVADVNGVQTVVDGPVVCFAAGTLIRTPMGDVAVETLKVGDVVVTTSGEMRPVKWIGHSEIEYARRPRDRLPDPDRRRCVRPRPAVARPLRLGRPFDLRRSPRRGVHPRRPSRQRRDRHRGRNGQGLVLARRTRPP